MKVFYRNRLPHIVPPGGVFFVTFRLADALPQVLLKSLQEAYAVELALLQDVSGEDLPLLEAQLREKYFHRYEHQLDGNPYGNCWLRSPALASIVQEQLHRYDGAYYELIAYCIMPNHVHVLFDFAIQLLDEDQALLDQPPDDYVPLHKVLKWIKGASARYINQSLGRIGTVWAKDSWDRRLRQPGHARRVVNYILQNPVKARLVAQWEDWPFSYWRGETDMVR
jgi:REP element-mobilizing transposase RayT